MYHLISALTLEVNLQIVIILKKKFKNFCSLLYFVFEYKPEIKSVPFHTFDLALFPCCGGDT